MMLSIFFLHTGSSLSFLTNCCLICMLFIYWSLSLLYVANLVVTIICLLCEGISFLINTFFSGFYLSCYVWKDIPDSKNIFLNILS